MISEALLQEFDEEIKKTRKTLERFQTRLISRRMPSR